MHLQQYNPAVYKSELAALRKKVKTTENLKIIATDISRDAIEISKVNAGLAQVDDLIEWEQCDFAATQVPQATGGVVVFNPEYGERLGQLDELHQTYARIGDFLKQQCKGYQGFIFTGNLDLAKKIGLRASSRIELYNGKIDCRLLQYELYEGTRRPVIA
jgi:putative N6-adenine-specific DNA methylase